MKKIISLLLALLMITVSFASFVSCDRNNDPEKPSDEIKIPEGYVEYKDEYISFAHPENWEVSNSSTVIILETGTGNNITVVYEPKSTLYETMTVEYYTETFGAFYKSMGIEISNVKVEQLTSKGGQKITKIQHTSKTAAVPAGMTQTLYTINSGDRSYVVSVTAVTSDNSFSNTVFETLKALK